MSTFVFNKKVNDPSADIVAAALGAAGDGWGNEEVGKAVKLGAANNYELCADGDEIEGFLISIEPNTVNQDVSFGSVQRDKRVEAVLAVGVTGAVVGDMVVSDVQEIVGAQLNGNKALVKLGTAASQLAVADYDYTERTPNTFLWRIIKLVTDGEAGSTVLLERI